MKKLRRYEITYSRLYAGWRLTEQFFATGLTRLDAINAFLVHACAYSELGATDWRITKIKEVAE